MEPVTALQSLAFNLLTSPASTHSKKERYVPRFPSIHLRKQLRKELRIKNLDLQHGNWHNELRGDIKKGTY